MKKIFNILLAVSIALPLFTACETDNDSNPVITEPTTFTLNTPAYAANNVYDLRTAETLELTCSQPDYGFTAATTYKVQIALEPEFVEAEGDTKANYGELESLFTSAKLQIDAQELNLKLMDLWSEQKGEEEYGVEPISLYIRLKANITGSDRGVITSNTIELPKVLGTTEGALQLPKKFYMVGPAFDDAAELQTMPAVSGMKGQFWKLVYLEAGKGFKLAVKDNEAYGMTNKVTLDDKAEADAGGTDNIEVANSGWYVVFVKIKVQNSEYVFTVTFYPGDVYLFGATNGAASDVAWTYMDDCKFTTPTTKDGVFTSPQLKAAGEVRMCVKTEIDWWRTEFTLYQGNIFYRENNNINDSWNKDMGSDYSIQGQVGNVVELNFTEGTGEKK